MCDTDISVIIVAGGSGTRMGGDIPKQFLPLAGKPILVHTVERFAGALPSAQIITVLPASQMERWRAMAAQWGLAGRITLCEGGENRFSSVKRGLALVDGRCRIVAVHDGVRPLVSRRTIAESIDAARREGAAIPVVAAVDSFREVTAGGSHPVDRERLRAVQTPQVFRADLLRRAYGAEFDPAFTDDASVVERLGVRVALVEGDRANVKITTPVDLAVAGALLAAAGRE